MAEIKEFKAWRVNGFLMLLLTLAVIFFTVVLVKDMILAEDVTLLWMVIVLFVLIALTLSGFFVVHPNEARVVVFVGRYVGTVRDAGFWWTNPFTTKTHVSLRIHNFNSERLKVNDLAGNPIEIAAVVVWRVVDSARALFDVENYAQFVAIQSETAIRTLASHYPYDAHDDAKPSLRGSPNEVSENLTRQVQARLQIAGVEISEGRISHLAYAPEIAQAMLRRQQAEAIVAARQKIVEGAVGMVEIALKMLADQNVVHLDDERKAAMVNNLLVALVSEHEATPILNAGTLYTS
jgi:regulator of protease activity HflC (stomatin/prohibitin superfamily)